ncbi:MAG: T9SS type A sorting domain-containing protein [candidate division Zixibacteria bacterium]|nr:T9SS type A sorting domain-containing protein [candidate division Zixibacteria bacterium]
MRRIAFFVVFTCLIFSFGLASAQVATITANEVGGFYMGDMNYQGDITISLTYTNGWDARQLPTNAYALTSSDGATWADYDINLVSPIPAGYGVAPGAFDNFLKDHPLGNPPDGVSPDIWGVGGITIFGAGWVSGATYGYTGPLPWSNVVYEITFTTDGTGEGKHITLAQSTFTGFTWVWSQLEANPGPAANVNPVFGGPYTWELVVIPDLPPDFDVEPAQLEGSHCAPITFDFGATDPDPHETPPANTITFSVTDDGAGTATIDANSGFFSYTGTIDDVYETIFADVTATEDDAAFTTLHIPLVCTNVAPNPTECGKEYRVKFGSVNELVFKATDNCTGDPMTWYIVDWGTLGVDTHWVGNVLQFNPDLDDVGKHTVTIGVTDGKDASECTYDIDVSQSPEVYIEKVHDQYQGQFADVNVTMSQFDMGGFDFLIAYDASALTFMGANTDLSALYNDCGWEYFEYRFGPFGNCGTGCPTGQLRVVGMAETNNGPVHPTCFQVGTNEVIFTLKFLVSNDRNLNCSFVPIRFYWYDCGDNTLSNDLGTELYIANDVFDYVGEEGVDTWYKITPDPKSLIKFPTFLGAEDDCVTSGGDNKPAVSRFIDFFNGGIDIICSDSVDKRGDLNLDGLAYTIADAVIFTNYFVYGLSAFGAYYEGSIAASDVNADGLPLTVSDLVYLIRVIIGDAFPYPKVISTVSAEYWVENGVLSVDREMGAIYLELDRDADVELLANNMEMKANDGKVIVYSLEGNAVSGQVLRTDAKIVNIEMAAKDGSIVNGAEVPRNFSLSQNYPNPFNPDTKIGFNLSKASDYTLTIYNVTGQVVDVFSGSADAGSHEINWNASNVASGIYFYKLDAGNFSETKKMILLK